MSAHKCRDKRKQYRNPQARTHLKFSITRVTVIVMRTLTQDVRYGLRMLGKSWGLTTIVAITLALGISANTAIFSVLNGWLLRPLPVRAPEQITVLAIQKKERGPGQLSYPALQDLR